MCIRNLFVDYDPVKRPIHSQLNQAIHYGKTA
jgi:hypothetical protein